MTAPHRADLLQLLAQPQDDTSSYHRPTSWTPIGSPQALAPNGSDKAGTPVKLNGTVARMMPRAGTVTSPTRNFDRACGGAEMGQTGHSRTSKRSKYRASSELNSSTCCCAPR
jgi:hypothetical protein